MFTELFSTTTKIIRLLFIRLSISSVLPSVCAILVMSTSIQTGVSGVISRTQWCVHMSKWHVVASRLVIVNGRRVTGHSMPAAVDPPGAFKF